MSVAVFNRRWATLILESLTRHQVKHVCIAPGSRSTALTLAAAAHPHLICHTHFDERGLGHLALGLAKASGTPVAVIVTSGTAVANLYPALIEASLTGEKLVLLTADRPPELIDCGANQAIRQPGMFASYPVQALDLPRPTPEISARWLVSAIDNAMAQQTHGAVHINCPFAEPLYGEDTGEYTEWLEQLGDWWQGHQPWLSFAPVQNSPAQPDWLSWRQKRGVIIAGRICAHESELLVQWADKLGWPLISDVQAATGNPLPYADLWLASPQAKSVLERAQLVVQFGGGLTGKRLLQWQAACQPEEYWLIDALPGRLDPAQHRGRRIQTPVPAFLLQHPAQHQPDWAPELDECAARAGHAIELHLASTFGEAAAAWQLPSLLPEHGQLFLGNSLIVRLADAFAQLPAGYPIFANRGASGIDGLLSTAAGVQRATCKPTLVLLGDISALYDLNALALMRQCSAPTVIIVVNNNGGQIFSLLPTPEAERQQFYCMPQNVDFQHAAAMFGLDYASPTSMTELHDAVTQCWQHGGVKLVELKVNETDGAECLRSLVSEASQS
ncbi:2-succinyl-5-enolpyruvyl-6-hydroxy-3-cyclohexene-1-carboxylic-acid synthase [Rahnella inusitata]|uniref:2-succinyl-5-enolpyruvyl-6-hydroxy-3-cyclohexene-1-carboxylate synthase n=1 Tax=Rahnella inusitata TaxID=58169 RepID=A0ABX9P603_9GAMM|nr:2-succinyl-5-enolpyruvyl-6-hydroxy-3-cyclohexene-1-carboxylic-acid synthase [Rahnella inusitata]QUT16784.1 2-succinyl-5-enolpyruvyl-6-hydroxy-3-cyclohexene-1-carboxylic-acid synthase [Rahnella inusitata]RJT15756.1 2-succinyl-5-enolpyruvyl-6-hydroxy-3-cyclohexene-1-carboxylic-acid synthase [Rahnella inusitata]